MRINRTKRSKEEVHCIMVTVFVIFYSINLELEVCVKIGVKLLSTFMLTKLFDISSLKSM